jgi:hypothetical protein
MIIRKYVKRSPVQIKPSQFYSHHIELNLPNATIKHVALLLCIQETVRSNMSFETSYAAIFHGFLQSIQANSVL